MSAAARPSAAALRRQLRNLKAKERQLRRIRKDMKSAAGGFGSTPFGNGKTAYEAYTDDATPDRERLLHKEALPMNVELEASLRKYHAMHRDPRPRLQILRSLYTSVVLSLGSPVGAYDPLDVKPQPFALGSYLALPLFTSLPYLQDFCCRFGHTVRGPDGRLWGAADREPHRPKKIARSAKASRSAKAKATARAEAEQEREFAEAASIERFDIKSATALPVHGAFEKPYLYGYYGAASTVMELARVVDKTELDIVVNPASPLELVLGSATSLALTSKSNLVLRAMRDVENAVRSELGAFFRRHCPEVLTARSVLMPQPAPPGQPLELGTYELIVGITSEDFELTTHRLSHAKMMGDVIGDDSMVLMPSHAVPEHLDAGTRGFYDRNAELADRANVLAAAERGGGLAPLGESLVVDSVHTGWGGPLGDVAMDYTEPHAVWNREANLKRLAREGGAKPPTPGTGSS